MTPPLDHEDDQPIPQIDGNLSLGSMDLSNSESELSNDKNQNNFIPVIISENRLPKSSEDRGVSANIVINHSSKKVMTATQMPVVVNLNPRSVYNKKEEFKTMMDQLDVDICFMSESWDREGNGLEKVIRMDDYQIVKNIVQRRSKGGKPALIIKKEKYFIKELCPSVITVPPTVEATWALLTPKIQNNSEVKHIAVASVYYAKRTKRKDFIDHIIEAYNVLLAKYGQGLQFIIAGDYNRLNIKPILNLSPNLSQMVSIPTRTNPNATLDKIITTLGKYYLPPTSLPPLDNDVNGNGKPSDHLIIIMRPISQNNCPKPQMKIIKYRPLPESGMLMFKQWLQTESWSALYQLETAHEKAAHLHRELLAKLDCYLPVKILKIRKDDQAWVNNEIKSLDRRCKREYSKRKKSMKWKSLNDELIQKCEKAKKDYSKNIVNDLKTSNPSQWHSKIKIMSSQCNDNDIVVQELVGLPSEEQAELIADQFTAVSNLYEPLQTSDIDIENIFDDRPPPEINPYLVYLKIKSIKKKTATVIGDIPMTVIKFCAEEISFPLSDVYIRAIEFGEYPDLYKVEIVTPVPKVFPPQTTKDLRKIAGTPNFSRLFEKFLAEIMVEDMKASRDPSQYGNTKGVSTQHYLIKMVDRILTILDTNNQNEAYAVVVQLVDWAQAFDRQCPKQGIQSFIKNGVRKSIIPVLISYFQNRKMMVKWKDNLSSSRDLPGGGPQGSSIGLIEYDSQSNDNTDFLSPEDKFKFVDDLSTLELINLIMVGLSSYNFKHHVASDVGIDQLFLPSTSIQSQSHMDKISEWTQQKQMKLNEKKSNLMIFNFTRNYQFSTRVYLNNSLVDIIDQTTLLGTVVSTDMSWHSNTQYITQRGYQRMTMLRKLYEFDIPKEDLVMIYNMYIRSVLEYNSNVWFSSITNEERDDIERVQRVACKIILKDEYTGYNQALEILNLQSLSDRRQSLAKRFALKCVKNEKLRDLFPLNQNNTDLRSGEKYIVKFARTSRLQKSTIPALQKMLNRQK